MSACSLFPCSSEPIINTAGSYLYQALDRAFRFFGTLKERSIVFLKWTRVWVQAIQGGQKEWLWSNDFLPRLVHRTRSGAVGVTGDTRGRDRGNPRWLRKEEASERISVHSPGVRGHRSGADAVYAQIPDGGIQVAGTLSRRHVPRNWAFWPHSHCLPILPEGLQELSLSSSCGRRSRR